MLQNVEDCSDSLAGGAKGCFTTAPLPALSPHLGRKGLCNPSARYASSAEKGQCAHLVEGLVWIDIQMRSPVSLPLALGVPAVDYPPVPVLLVHKHMANRKLHALTVEVELVQRAQLSQLSEVICVEQAQALHATRVCKLATQLLGLATNWSFVSRGVLMKSVC